MRFLLITAIGMCHFLWVHHFGMACLVRVEGQYTTIERKSKTTSFWPKLFNCWSTVWLDFVLHICFMLNMEQLTELTKMLGAAVQQLQ